MLESQTKINLSIITHANADKIYKQGLKILTTEKSLLADFKATDKFDSSIFAVILGWRRIAKRKRYNLSINLSQHLEKLAIVYGIKEIL
jgi:ABC-type transporter Mla MlaB component